MTKRILILSCFLLALSFVCAAADVTGKWVAQVPGREGQTRETTFDLKAAGDYLDRHHVGPRRARSHR